MNDPIVPIREHVDDLSYYLARWAERDDSKAQPEVRAAANEAVDAIDALLRELHGLRGQLLGEMRASDDATAARVDTMIAQYHAFATYAENIAAGAR